MNNDARVEVESKGVTSRKKNKDQFTVSKLVQFPSKRLPKNSLFIMGLLCEVTEKAEYA